MRKLFIYVVIVFALTNANAQNVGIGTSSPVYKLDVAGRLRLQQSSGTAGIYFDGVTLPTRSFIGTYDDNYFGIYGSGAGWNFFMNVNNGNIGIGENAPAYKLDVNGRLRLQHSSNTAGIVLDGTSLPTRSFIGTMDDNHVGLYGYGGAGWNFVMNVNDGNVGIGTSAPTAKLDVNGDIKIRGSFPKKGSVLTSDNTSGNASWADPVAFKAVGRNTTNLASLSLNTWTKYYFESVAEHNIGLAYDGNNSQFIAPENGIYHFDAHMSLVTDADFSFIRLVKQGGGTLVLAEHKLGGDRLNNPPQWTRVRSSGDNIISTDVKLNAGEIVWLEIYYANYVSFPVFPYSDSHEVSYFSGHLISRF